MVRITTSSRASDVRPTGCVRPGTTAGPCTVIITSDQLRRVLNPNIPPSYDQAITGKDRSIKLEEGMARRQSGAATETLVSDDSPPAYTPVSQSTSEFPSASPTPLPTYSSHISTHVNIEPGKIDDDEPLLT